MNCSDILHNNIHELYLLNKLTDEQNKEFEKHLESCFSCKKELERQQSLITGIRDVGTIEMKEEIRRQVGILKEKPSPINWTVILKTAAIFFVLVTIPALLYYNQTRSSKPIGENFNEPEIVEKFHTYNPKKEGEIQIGERSIDKSEKKSDHRSVQSPIVSAQVEAERDDLDESSGAYEEDEQLAISARTKESKYGDSKDLPPAEMASGSIQPEERRELLKKEKTQRQLITTSDVESDLDKTIYNSVRVDSLDDFISYKTSRFRDKYDFAEFDKNAGKSVYQTQESQKAAQNKLKEIQREEIGSPDLLFTSGNKLIRVNLMKEGKKQPIDKKNNLPFYFEINTVQKDSVFWEMNWFLGKEFINIDAPDISIITYGNDMMLIRFSNQHQYKVDLKQDSTKAVLENK